MRILERFVQDVDIKHVVRFDVESGRTWIYPSNMSHRPYQFDIVKVTP